MGLLDKFKRAIEPDDDGYDDFDDELFSHNNGAIEDIIRPNSNNNTQGNNNYNMGQQSQYVQPNQGQQQNYQLQQQMQQQNMVPVNVPSVSLQGQGSQSFEIKTMRVQSFENGVQAADHLLNKRTVLLNLEDVNKETARRLIDFLGGVIYAIQGDLKRVSTNTFVITPNTVDVTAEQIKDNQINNGGRNTGRDMNDSNSIY